MVIVLFAIAALPVIALECVVKQAPPGTTPTVHTLPDGTLLFNDLQTSIDRCPFNVIRIPRQSSAIASNTVGCISIASNVMRPLMITGDPQVAIDGGMLLNRSVIAFNKSHCTPLSVRGVSDLVLDMLTLQVTFDDDSSGATSVPRGVLAIHNATNVQLNNIRADFVADSPFAFSVFEAFVKVSSSNNISVTNGILSGRTIHYADRSMMHESYVSGIVVPTNVSFPNLRILRFESCDWIRVIGGTYSLTSELGGVLRAINTTNVLIANVHAVTMIGFPAERPGATDPPPMPQRELMLFEDHCSDVRIVGATLTAVCGVWCQQTLYPALIAFRRSLKIMTPVLLQGVLVANVSALIHGIPWTPQYLGTEAVTNIVVIEVDALRCFFAQNVTGNRFPNVASNAVIVSARTANNVMVIDTHVWVLNQYLNTTTSTPQSSRVITALESSSILISDTGDLAFLDHGGVSLVSCPSVVVPLPLAAAEPAHCCTVRTTVMWSCGAGLLVATLFVVLLVRTRRRPDFDFSPEDKPPLPIARREDADLQQALLSDPTLATDSGAQFVRGSIDGSSERLQASNLSILRKGSSCGTVSKTPLVASVPRNASNDMVLYMPAGGEWCSSRSVPGWAWTPKDGDVSSAQLSIAGSHDVKYIRSYQESPAITLSPPRAALSLVAAPVTVVNGTADANPFAHATSGMREAASVHSSQYSSSTASNQSDDEALVSHEVSRGDFIDGVMESGSPYPTPD